MLTISRLWMFGRFIRFKTFRLRINSSIRHTLDFILLINARTATCISPKRFFNSIVLIIPLHYIFCHND